MAKQLDQNLPYRRVYFDLPPEIYDQMVKQAKAAGMTQKAYMCDLVMQASHRKK